MRRRRAAGPRRSPVCAGGPGPPRPGPDPPRALPSVTAARRSACVPRDSADVSSSAGGPTPDGTVPSFWWAPSAASPHWPTAPERRRFPGPGLPRPRRPAPLVAGATVPPGAWASPKPGIQWANLLGPGPGALPGPWPPVPRGAWPPVPSGRLARRVPRCRSGRGAGSLAGCGAAVPGRVRCRVPGRQCPLEPGPPCSAVPGHSCFPVPGRPDQRESPSPSPAVPARPAGTAGMAGPGGLPACSASRPGALPACAWASPPPASPGGRAAARAPRHRHLYRTAACGGGWPVPAGGCAGGTAAAPCPVAPQPPQPPRRPPSSAPGAPAARPFRHPAGRVRPGRGRRVRPAWPALP